MLIRILIALIATAGIVLACTTIIPNIMAGHVDSAGPLALGTALFMYGFLMAYMFNPTYRAEMNGPPPTKPDASPPDEAA